MEIPEWGEVDLSLVDGVLYALAAELAPTMRIGVPRPTAHLIGPATWSRPSASPADLVLGAWRSDGSRWGD